MVSDISSLREMLKLSHSKLYTVAKPLIVIGRREGRISIVQRVKLADYFVSQFAKVTTVEEFEDHIKNVLGARNFNVNCRKVKIKFDTYSSFPVKVTDEEEVN